jgi:integrase
VATGKRRGHGEDSVYFDAAKNRYVGAVSLGFDGDGRRLRRKVLGRSKAEVRQKLKDLRAGLDMGVQSPASYTVRAAVDDWLAEGLSGRSQRTLTLYRDGVKPLTDKIGHKQLRKLTAADVRSALAGLSGQMSTRSLQIAHNCLVRAIRHAEAGDIAGRNVAALIRPPAGRQGRPSKALTVDQAHALVIAASGGRRAEDRRREDHEPYRLHAYVVLLLTTGLRPEEARVLRWDHLDLEAGTVAVWRSDRAGGDTKTPKSRRTLKLPLIALEALRERRAIQAAERLQAGESWHDDGLVFTTAIGTMLDQHNIRREFRQITKAAGLGTDWVPRELRHTFVSIMSAGGIPVEEIARVVGHKQTSTTEVVYRRELRPVIATGAEIMDQIFRQSIPIPPRKGLQQSADLDRPPESP